MELLSCVDGVVYTCICLCQGYHTERREYVRVLGICTKLYLLSYGIRVVCVVIASTVTIQKVEVSPPKNLSARIQAAFVLSVA